MPLLDPRQYVGLAGASEQDEWETVQGDSEWETVDVDVDASVRNPHFATRPRARVQTALGDTPEQTPREVGESYFEGGRRGLQNIGGLGPGLAKSAPILGRSVVASGLRQLEQVAGEPGESYTLTRIEEANRQAVRDLPKGTQRLVGETVQSIGESAAPMVGMGLAGVGGAAVGGPVAGYGAAAATGVAMNFNAEKNRSLREIKMHLDDISFNARGHGLTGNEWAVVQEKVDNATDMKALAEGVFETAGDLASFGFFRAATATKGGEQAVNRFTDWVAKQPALNRYFIGTISGAPTELATETMTQDVQSYQDYLLGARDKPSTTAESFKEIAPQTLLQQFLMGAGGTVIDKGVNKYREARAEKSIPRDAPSIPGPPDRKGSGMPGSEAPPEPAKTGTKPQAVPSIAATSLPQEAQALLASIYGTEAPDYRTIYGGQKFDSFEDHPRINVPIKVGPNKGKTSSAAGRPQFLASTWDAQANKLGLKDFSPENQDIAAWDLAETEYKKKTGRDLLGDLRSGLPLGSIGQALKGQWTSLPSGIEQGTSASNFEKRYRQHLSSAGFPVSPVQEQVLRGEQGESLAPQGPDETESEFEAFNRRVLERARKRRQQPEVLDEKEGQAKTKTDAVLADGAQDTTGEVIAKREEPLETVRADIFKPEVANQTVEGTAATRRENLVDGLSTPGATIDNFKQKIVNLDAELPRPQVGPGLAPPPIEAQDAKQIQQAEAIDVGSGQQQGIRQESASVAIGSQGIRQGGQKKEVGIQPLPDSGVVARKAPAVAIKLTPAKDTGPEDLNYIAGVAATLNEKGLESRLSGRFGRHRVLQWKNDGMLRRWGQEATRPSNVEDEVLSRVRPTNPSKGRTIIDVDISKVDGAWKQDGEFYVGSEGGNQGKQKYENAKKYVFESGQDIDPPRLVVDEMGSASFVDGRHRFAVMRDAGMRVARVSVDKETIKNIRKHGYMAGANQSAPAQSSLHGTGRVALPSQGVAEAKSIKPPVVPDAAETREAKSETAAILEGLQAQAVATTKMAEAMVKLAETQTKVNDTQEPRRSSQAEFAKRTQKDGDARRIRMAREAIAEGRDVSIQDAQDAGYKEAPEGYRERGPYYEPIKESREAPVKETPQKKGAELAKKLAFAKQRLGKPEKKYAKLVQDIGDAGLLKASFIKKLLDDADFTSEDSTKLMARPTKAEFRRAIDPIIAEYEDNHSVELSQKEELDFDVLWSAWDSAMQELSASLEKDHGVSLDDYIGGAMPPAKAIEAMVDEWNDGYAVKEQGGDKMTAEKVVAELERDPNDEDYDEGWTEEFELKTTASDPDYSYWAELPEYNPFANEPLEKTFHKLFKRNLAAAQGKASKGRAGTGMATDDAWAQIEEGLGKKTANALREYTDIVDSAESEEGSMLSLMDDDNLGVYVSGTGRIQLFADKLSRNNASSLSAISLAMHEGLHAGLEPLLGAEQFEHLKTWITNLADAGDRGSQSKYAKEAAKARQQAIDADTKAEHVAEESLSHFIQVPSNRKAPFLRRMWAKIKAWAVRAGVPLRLLDMDAPLLAELVLHGIRAKTRTDGVGKRYAKSPVSARAAVADRVDRLLRGQSRELPIYLGDTPDVLVASGMKRLPMGMGEAAALTSTLPAGDRPKGHGLSVGDMAALVDAIADPVAIMQKVGRDQVPGGVLVVTDLIKRDGNPVVVAVHPSVNMLGIGKRVVLANKIATAFALDSGFLRKEGMAGKFTYLNQEKSQEAGLGFAVGANQILPGQRRSPSTLPQSGSRSVSSGSIVPPWVRRTILTPGVIDKRGDRKAKLSIDPWTRDEVFSKASGKGSKMYREENRALADRINRFGSLPSVLRYIAENGITPQSRARARKLLGYDSVNGTRIAIEDIEDDKLGLYRISRDEIRIAPLTARGVPMEQVVLHEASHAVTIHELRRNPKVRAKALELFHDVRGATWYTRLIKEPYGLHNEEEFVAEVFSNPTFRQYLREARPLWHRFVSLIRELLRLTPNEARDFLAEADQLVEWISLHQDARGKPKPLGMDDDSVAAKGNQSAEDILYSKRGQQRITPQPESSPRSGKPTKLGKTIDKGNEVLRAIPRLFQDSLRRWDTVQQAVLDSGGDIEPEMDVKAALERYPTRTASFLQAFMRNQVKPLLERSQKLGIDLRDIGLYLYAVHAPHRNEYVQGIRDDMPEAGSGMTDAEAAELVKKFEARQDFNDFKALADDFRDLNDAKLDLLVDGGVYTQEQADSMREALPLHVPLKGFEVVDEKGESQGQGTGRGKSMPAKVDKSLAGRRSRAGMIIENIVHDYERAITLVEKAEVGKALTALIDANPDKELWTIGEPEQVDVVVKTKAGRKVVKRPVQYDPEKEIRVIRDGKAQRIQIHDPLALRAYNQLYSSDLGTVFKVLDWSNRILREFWTAKNPAFLLINPMRDVQTAFMRLTGEQGATFAVNAMKRLNWARKAMVSHEAEKVMSAEDKRWVNLYGEAGGHTGMAWIGDLDTTSEKMDRLLKRARKDPTYVRAIARNTVDWIEKHNIALENMTRLAAFREHMEQAANGEDVFEFSKTLAGRRARNEAGRIAREITVNFNKKGDFAREMSAWWLFFNPGVQGAQNIWWSISQSPHKHQVWAIIGGLMGIGFTLGMVSGDDDDLLQESQEQRNFIYRRGEMLYQWPIAYGLSWFVDLGRLLARTVKGGDLVEAAKDITMSFISNFTAFGDIGRAEHLDMSTLFQQAMPTAARIPYLWAANKNAFGGDMVPRWPGQEGKPDAYKMHRGTQGSGYAEIADFMNRLTGGDELSPGMVDFSPELIKHLWTSITGGLGRFIVDAFINLPTKLINKDTKLPDDIPVANKFMHDLTEKEYQGRLYDEMGEAVVAKNRGESSALARLGKEDYRTRRELNSYRDALRGAIINHDKKSADKAVQDIKDLSNEIHMKYVGATR